MGLIDYNHMAGLAAYPSDYAAPDMQQYPSGRAVYEVPSITGLNLIPVDRLAGYALKGATFTSIEALPLAPEDVVTTLLVEGSWLEANGEVQRHIIHAAQNEVCQWVPLADGTDVTRVWYRPSEGLSWAITDYRDYGTMIQTQVEESGVAPDALVKYHYNPLSPAGILYPARCSFERLEEIAVLIREAQLGPGAKTAISGYVRNRTQVEGDLRSRKSWFFTGSDAPLDRMTSTAVVDQLIKEFERLQPLYYQLVRCVDTSSPIQRPSGTDRELVLDPMFSYVDYVRAQVDAVLALYGASWTYDDLKPELPIPGQPFNTTGDTDNGRSDRAS